MSEILSICLASFLLVFSLLGCVLYWRTAAIRAPQLCTHFISSVAAFSAIFSSTRFLLVATRGLPATALLWICILELVRSLQQYQRSFQVHCRSFFIYDFICWSPDVSLSSCARLNQRFMVAVDDHKWICVCACSIHFPSLGV